MNAIALDSGRLALLKRELRSLVRDGTLPCLAYMLRLGGDLIDAEAIGTSDVEGRSQVGEDTVFPIYSMSKPVTIVALLTLIEQGLCAFEDPLTKFAPEFSDLRVAVGVGADGAVASETVVRPPCLRELMTHTAGFGYGLMHPGPVNELYRDARPFGAGSLSEMAARISPLPLLFQPGASWAYSISIDILGLVIERISGVSLGTYLSDSVFRPLGMSRTGFSRPPPERLALLRSRASPGVFVDARDLSWPGVNDLVQTPAIESGGGGLFSTVDDFSKFAGMLANGGVLDGVRVLSPASVALIGRNYVAGAIWDQLGGVEGLHRGAFGFGLSVIVSVEPFRVGGLEPEGVFGFAGAGGGWFWVDVRNRLSFVGMTACLEGAGRDLGELSRTLVYQAVT